MADVSVRFQIAGDSEIVLNLATPQAVRLVEALMGKVADAMAAPDRLAVGNSWQQGTPPPPAPPAFNPGQRLQQ
ncbi:hypothetical protein UG55_1005144 [Frankia sp. EI5c]|uniref:hypothetical protein n=1 Tax=Frankia sp. EI5c TaxID=683316 RepID=UPI0007C2E8F2|nr:hypothetical protein [Frankia sp. EI5c]OAA28630.1 hypothetical protein UG55_1005144 [Frankia sp. EI5c]